MRLLIVRLGSLGDVVHALPAAAALRRAYPGASLDWVVDERNQEILELVPIIDRRIVLRTRSRPAWRDAPRVISALRRARYDLAVDLQGLIKSAVLARASGARRVAGFARAALRERAARLFYTEAHDTASAVHVIDKNLALARALGALEPGPAEFPIAVPRSSAPAAVRARLSLGASAPLALLNPGGAWPNKRWPPARFGQIARHLRARHGLPSAVLWGPGDEPLARAVAESSAGAAAIGPVTTIADLVALASEAALLVSGDTGPLHIAAAVGTPVVGLYGPTDPRRNGPWAADDVTVSRVERCQCPHRRRCTAAAWCLEDIGVEEVAEAVDRRLAAGRPWSQPSGWQS